MRFSILLLLCAACSSNAPTPAAPVAAVHAPSYEVHEWGLLHGTLADHATLSGPAAQPVAVALAKPVLYFHLDDPEPILLEVEVRAHGPIVEHWPSTSATGERVTWARVTLRRGACHGSYPSLGDPICASLPDGCEAAELASVETSDSDCVYWPTPLEDGPTQPHAHLFYRAAIDGTPQLPLRLEPQPDGRLRVTATGSEPVVGSLLRVRLTNGNAGVSNAATIATPPAPNASILLDVPAGPIDAASNELTTSLRAAGLTEQEAAAFHRAWDTQLFAGAAAAAGEARATLVPPPQPSTSLLYVLPSQSVEALATLRFNPQPRVVRRAIVVWIDEARAP